MKTDWAKRFVSYHAANPHVFDLYIKYAEQALKANKKFSTKLLNERIRWESMIGGWDYKTTNSMTAYYARLLMWKDTRFRNSMSLKRIPVDGDTEDLYDVTTWDKSYWGQF